MMVLTLLKVTKHDSKNVPFAQYERRMMMNVPFTSSYNIVELNEGLNALESKKTWH